MNNFLTAILRNNSISDNQDPVISAFKVGNPVITYNNACETFWEGSILIPVGYEGSVFADITAGLEGSGNPGPVNGVFPLTGNYTLPEGKHDYTINLGNSGEAGVASTFVLQVTLNDPGATQKSIIRSRTAAQSIFYDNAPC